MFCIIAFIVLGIVSIFSASHRELAKEAFDCVFRRVTFRPCNTGFKEKMKARLVGRLLIRSEVAARLFNKHFELLSWILFITTVLSIFWTGKGLFNYYMYGSCNGLNKTGFCALDPKGENNKVSQAGTSCSTGSGDESKVTLSGVNLDLFPAKGDNTTDTVVFIGCFGCEYTRKAYPLIKQLIEKNPVRLVFAHYPVKDNTMSLLNVEYCAYKENQQAYWTLVDRLFSTDTSNLDNRQFIDTTLQDVGYDLEKIQSCEKDPQTNVAVTDRRIVLEKTNIYGTPLVFINGKGLVGPKPYRVYERILKGWAFWK